MHVPLGLEEGVWPTSTAVTYGVSFMTWVPGTELGPLWSLSHLSSLSPVFPYSSFPYNRSVYSEVLYAVILLLSLLQ